MKTKNLTIEERQLLVYELAGYNDDTFYTFYHYAMDMYLKDKGFPPHQREKIKKLNLFKEWFGKQFEKRDEFIINDMLVLNLETNEYHFYDFDTDSTYTLHQIQDFKLFYEFLHLDFSRYDMMPFVFDFFDSRKQKIKKSFVYQNAYYQEKLEFFFHYS
ncbi:hypothetical protein V9L05_19855 [Bernardetia sp. Wsw4-3y2]|uniref:hypothetical protein n=1 Tax=Bernardetia sp. Wsw4-3y2 TaxID=3127471 RepID=UPI0030CE1E9A